MNHLNIPSYVFPVTGGMPTGPTWMFLCLTLVMHRFLFSGCNSGVIFRHLFFTFSIIVKEPFFRQGVFYFFRLRGFCPAMFCWLDLLRCLLRRLSSLLRYCLIFAINNSIKTKNKTASPTTISLC